MQQNDVRNILYDSRFRRDFVLIDSFTHNVFTHCDIKTGPQLNNNDKNEKNGIKYIRKECIFNEFKSSYLAIDLINIVKCL